MICHRSSSAWTWSTTDLVTDILFCSARMPRFTLHNGKLLWRCGFGRLRPDPCHVQVVQDFMVADSAEPSFDLTHLYICSCHNYLSIFNLLIIFESLIFLYILYFLFAGVILYFMFLASFILFSTSVFNFLVAIYDLKKSGQSGFLKRHSKLLSAVEILVALGLAGAIVSAVLGTLSYGSNVSQMICFPKTSSGRFYSYTVPAQIIGVIGFIMAILIIKRMKQVYALTYLEGVCV